MLWFVYGTAFLSVFFLVLALNMLAEKKAPVKERLEHIEKMGGRDDEEDILKKSFTVRIVQPALKKLGSALVNLTPREIRRNLELRLTYAGNPGDLTVNSLLVYQLLAGIALPLLFIGLMLFLGAEPKQVVLLALIISLLGFYLPLLLINIRIARRQKAIERNLPDMLDLLLVSVEAGLGFDMALKRVAEKMPGELSRELNRALDEIRIGKPRSEALRDIHARTGVYDLGTFVGAVIQAEQLGSNIARTLGIQADTMRLRRRQRAEEAAMKAPIKMLFPLVFFILPSLFVVLLGPALLQIMEAFANL
ncbi:MAG TPA: type II secretion system F family protein [Firmicutes bacterium]|nr:type II secretion system F family protein [Bacillota bacterium]